MKGNLVYTTTGDPIRLLNKTYGRHYISETDSIVFVSFRTFQSQKFLKTEVDIVKYGTGYYAKGVIQSDSSHYILDHFLEQAIEAIPYNTLSYDEDTEVYIYELNKRFGLLNKEGILTEPKFESLKKRSDYQYVAKLNGKYGILEIENNDGW